MFFWQDKCETQQRRIKAASIVNSTRESKFPKMDLFILYSCVSGKISEGKRCFVAPEPFVCFVMKKSSKRGYFYLSLR